MDHPQAFQCAFRVNVDAAAGVATGYMFNVDSDD